MKTKTFALFAACAAALAFAVADPVKIAWKPTLGAVAKYKLNAVATVDPGSGPTEMKFAANVSSKIAEIKADGNIVVEETQSEMSILFGEQDFSSQAPPSATVKTTMNPRGETISREGGEGMSSPRLEHSLEFVYPEGDVSVGDSWTVKRAADSAKGLFTRETTYTYDGTEKIKEWDCHRIKITFKETDAPTNMTYEGTVWVRADDGSLVNASYKMKNVEFSPGLPPADSTANLTRLE